MRMSVLPKLCLALLLPLLLFACSDRGEQSRGALTEAGVLTYIPADSPYVFAAAAPMPDDVRDKLGASNKEMLESYRTIIATALDQEPEEGESTPQDAQERERIKAVIDGLVNMVDEDGTLPEAGIDRTSTGALYGVGLLPVMRISLSDDALFESAFSNLEEEAGAKMEVASVEDVSYRYQDFEKARLIVATHADQLVVTLVPLELSEDTLKAVLGIDLPARSIAQSAYLDGLAEKYGYQGYGVGYVDFERIVSTFLDDPSAVDAELLALMDYDASGLTDVCRAEIRSVAAIGPRLVTGYTDVSTESLKSNTVLELRTDIAAALATLTAPVPGLGSPHDSLLSFGMSFNIPALREFYSARLDALEADPYECELFADMQQELAAGREKLNQPVPPVVYSLTGFLAVIDNISGLDVKKGQPPTDIDMSFLVATNNAPSLVAMGAMFSPDIAALNLQPDGKPVKLPLPPMAAGALDSAYVAMTDEALAVAVGNGSESRLESMLAAAPSVPSPFMSMDMDAARYYSFLGEAMKFGNDEADAEEGAEIIQATSDMMKSFGNVFSRVAVAIQFTERGIEVPSTIVLAP
jgi:hypothetical protein